MLLCVKFRAFFAHNLAHFYIQKCHTNTRRAFYGINMAHFLPILWHKNAPQHNKTHAKHKTSPKSGHFLPILLPLLSRIYTAGALPASCSVAYPCKCTKKTRMNKRRHMPRAFCTKWRQQSQYLCGFWKSCDEVYKMNTKNTLFFFVIVHQFRCVYQYYFTQHNTHAAKSRRERKRA